MAKFSINTNLSKRKVKTADPGNSPKTEDVQNARYVDVDPMQIYAKFGDVIEFTANDYALDVNPSPAGFIEPLHLNPGETKSITIPLLADITSITMHLSIDGEDPKGMPNNEDPEIIVVPPPK